MKALHLAALLIFALIPAAARAQTQRPGADRPIVDLPRLDSDSLDVATVERVQLLLSGIHGAPDRTQLEELVPMAREVVATVALEPDFLPFQRGQALVTLAQWADEGVRAVYETVLAEEAEAEGLRHQSMLLLARVYGDSAVPVIEPYLGHPNVQFRLSAVVALGEIDSAAALSALDEAAQHETDPVVLARIEQASLHVR